MLAAAESVLWSPNPGPQTRALESTTYELLYGGEAGGGKTAFIVVGPLRWVANRKFNGVIFRRTYGELERDVVPKTWELYKPLGGEYNEQKHLWRFYDERGNPGGRVWLSHLQHDKDVFEHRGAEYQYVGFDELPSFSRFQYRYLVSRTRTTAGIPIWLRNTANPEPGWVRDMWAPWVRAGVEGYDGPTALDGEPMYYLVDEDSDEERWVPRGTPLAMARTFIRAGRRDNPFLDAEYVARLGTLDPVQRRRLRDGDWEADYSGGLLFQRGWFGELRDILPLGCSLVRYWDRAATEEKFDGKASFKREAKNDPDWTVGLLYARDRTGAFWIVDVVRMRGNPGQVEACILRTAEADEARFGKHSVTILLEQEPGSSGVADIAHYVRALAQYHVVPLRPSGKKVERAGPVSSQSLAGNVRIMKAEWNAALFAELEAFPKGKHDDQVDALSGAHNWLANTTLGGTASVRGERRAVNSGGY